MWDIHRTASVQAAAFFLVMVLLSVLGFVTSCIRARRSRWIMAALDLLLSGLVFILMCLMEFSRPVGFSDWILSGMIVLLGWFGIPILLALSFFKNIQNVSFVGKNLNFEIEPS